MIDISVISIFVIMAVAAVGIAGIYLFAIRPGGFLSFVQKYLVKYSSRHSIAGQFVYKSIGGCSICTTQRVADIMYLIFALNVVQWSNNYVTNSVVFMLLYCIFGGLVFYFSGILNRPAQQSEKEPFKKVNLQHGSTENSNGD